MQFSAQNLGPNRLYKGGKGEEKRGQNENEKGAWEEPGHVEVLELVTSFCRSHEPQNTKGLSQMFIV